MCRSRVPTMPGVMNPSSPDKGHVCTIDRPSDDESPDVENKVIRLGFAFYLVHNQCCTRTTGVAHEKTPIQPS